VRTRTGPARVLAVAALASCAALHACDADLLSFEANLAVPTPPPACDSRLGWFADGGAIPAVPWTPYDGFDDQDRIEDLPYGSAYQLCQWIDQGQAPCSLPSVAPGYASGQSASCLLDSSNGSPRSLAMVWLGLDECTANLFHSPCAALVGDLAACVQYFGSHAGELNCTMASAACDAYESVPGCDETVIQANPHNDTTDLVASACATSLPIVPGVACPSYEQGMAADAGDDGDATNAD
jgi:hypothetical protein